MAIYSTFFFPIISKVDAESAHSLAIDGLKAGLFPKPCVKNYENLMTQVFGIDFPNPIGLAAGFDKNCEVASRVLDFGFGFVEAGTVTPRPQSGNPKPRMFRLLEDKGVINRLGFNGKGMEEFVTNLTEQGGDSRDIIGANIGKNKDSESEVADYLTLLPIVYPLASYITVNISSPNTPGLRDIQKEEILDGFLSAIAGKRDELIERHKIKKPVLLKIAPDLSDAEIESVAALSLKHNMDGIIAGNTTISRPENLRSKYKSEAGGLSGKPLFELSTSVLRKMHKAVGGKIPLVGVGGVSSGADAYTKIKSGAALVQLYTGIVYEGFWIAEKIKEELSELLKRDGFKTVSEAVGADNR